MSEVKRYSREEINTHVSALNATGGVHSAAIIQQLLEDQSIGDNVVMELLARTQEMGDERQKLLADLDAKEKEAAKLTALADEWFSGDRQYQQYSGAAYECLLCGATQKVNDEVKHCHDCAVPIYAAIKGKSPCTSSK